MRWMFHVLLLRTYGARREELVDDLVRLLVNLSISVRL